MPVEATLLLTTSCPHCPGVLASLAELVKRGELSRLTLINLDQDPDAARSLGARSVPWVVLGPFVLTGSRSPAELALWARRAAQPDDMADAFHDLLKTGDLAPVEALVAAAPARLRDLLPIVANPEASMNVRVGAGAVLEGYAGHPALAALVPGLGTLSRHADHRVRVDACHYLGLSRSDAARPWLEACLADRDAEVRDIAREALA